MSVVTARPRKASRIVALAAACGLAVVSLSGCIKVNADLAIDSEATGSGTLSLELQKQAASLMGMTDLAAFESGLTTGDLGDQGLGAFGTCETSETDEAFVYTCSFTEETFAKDDGPWTLAKEGDQIIFTMVNEGSGSAEGTEAEDLLGGASLGEIVVNVTFPGPITGMQGAAATKTSDTTATVKGSLSDSMEVRITSEASGSGKIAALLVVLLALLVVALIIVVIVVLILRRKKSAPPAPVTEAVVAAAVVQEDAAVVEETAVVDETVVVEEPVVVEEEAAVVVEEEAAVVEETAVVDDTVVDEETVVRERPVVVEETAVVEGDDAPKTE